MLAKRASPRTKLVPIIMPQAARGDEEMDRVAGLDAGADDYIAFLHKEVAGTRACQLSTTRAPEQASGVVYMGALARWIRAPTVCHLRGNLL
jgi:two-component system phosphate regulon response regulator PhoB